MGKYISIAEREQRFIDQINKIGIKSFIDMADGPWDYYEIKLVNNTTRYWRTKNGMEFGSKLIVQK